jgi:ribosomal protein S18 acetylase RimI-like enzyme
MADFSLRPATDDDYDFLYDLNRLALGEYVAQVSGWDEKWEQQNFRERFDSDRRQVIRINGEDVGAFGFYADSDHVLLDYLAILPEYQRRGIGSRLIRSVIEEARKSGKPVRVQVLKPNPAAELYKRLGFVITEETERHFVMKWSPDTPDERN